MAKEEFDWIDDAFNDKKTAEDMERARGPKFAGLLLVVVVIVALVVIGISAVGLIGVLQTA